MRPCTVCGKRTLLISIDANAFICDYCISKFDYMADYTKIKFPTIVRILRTVTVHAPTR